MIKAWHFLPASRRLTHGDGRRVVAGETLTVPAVAVTNHGLHASRRVFEALRFAPGPILCRVGLAGTVIEAEDKLAASERTVQWMIDASPILHRFAVHCARLALAHLDKTPEAAANALLAKSAWIAGEADDRRLERAWEEAWRELHRVRGSGAWSACQAACQAAAPIDAHLAARDAAAQAIDTEMQYLAGAEGPGCDLGALHQTLLRRYSDCLEARVVEGAGDGASTPILTSSSPVRTRKAPRTAATP